MKRLTLLAVAFATCVAGSALAQAGGPMMPKGKWWRMPQVAKELRLTGDQQTKLDAIFNASSTELIDLKADVDKLGIELRAQLEKPQSARKDVIGVAQRLGAARGRLFEREIGMMVDMKAILNEDQWEMLRSKLEERAGRMRDEMRPQGGGPDRPRPRNPR
ncbi:MAG: periplasmic heavy metal sensor [Acidobacteria bacterium]|nr:periplasmic heavy metal sensor [Acidobacteriota bacterium]